MNLTLEVLITAYNQAQPVLYYGTSEGIARGKVLQQEARPGLPKAIYCHPDDLEQLRQTLPVRLVHLREWQPSHDDLMAYSEELVRESVDKMMAAAD